MAAKHHSEHHKAAPHHKKKSRTGMLIGKGLLGRARPRLVTAGMGAAIEIVEDIVQKEIESHYPEAGSKWWAGPAILFASSLVIKNERASAALSAVAGYEAAFNYKLNQFQLGKSPNSPVPTFTASTAAPALAPAAPAGTQGYDAGLMMGGNDAGLLQDALN